jgi:uncharacterized membrane protein YesL
MFRYGSPAHRAMLLLTNLMMLNLMVILTSLPIFTLGASISSMYSLTIKYAKKEDDSVFKAYYKAFKQNFKQATIIWIPNMLIGIALGAAAYYLSSSDTGAFLWIILAVLAFLFCLVSSMIYPMLGRYNNTTVAIIFNSINISIRNILPMLCVVFLNVVPWILAVEFTGIFLYLGLFWTFGGFSLIALLNSLVIARIFDKYTEAEPEEEAAL